MEKEKYITFDSTMLIDKISQYKVQSAFASLASLRCLRSIKILSSIYILCLHFILIMEFLQEWDQELVLALFDVHLLFVFAKNNIKHTQSKRYNFIFCVFYGWRCAINIFIINSSNTVQFCYRFLPAPSDCTVLLDIQAFYKNQWRMYDSKTRNTTQKEDAWHFWQAFFKNSQ